jgi:glycerophosphoryl diester phosphodiesterase
MFILNIVLSTFSVSALTTTAPYFTNETRPLILGHRGSTGLFPEHTHASYSSAYNEGVDFVEIDIQITKDGELVCNHDPTLKESTNIEDYASKYEDRRGNFTFPFPYKYQLDNDFLIHDFTLAELKELRRT